MISKATKVFFGGVSVCFCRLLFRFVAPQKMLFSSYYYMRSPFFGFLIKTNATIPGLVRLKWFAVSHILTLRTYSQVASAIIQSVSVYMIYVFPLLSIKN